MELLIGIVGIEDQDPLYTTAGRRGLRGKKTHLNTFRRGFRVHISVHAAFTRDEPVQVQEGIMQEQAFQEIVSGLVASGQNVRDTAAGDGERVGQLRLRNVFRLQELQKTSVHNSKIKLHKNKQIISEIQMKIVHPRQRIGEQKTEI